MVRHYKELNIWQKEIDLVKSIYSISNGFPKNEVYTLTSQMRRAAISVPSNIAEGFRRQHSKEFKQFLNIALASLAELVHCQINSRPLILGNPNMKTQH